MNIIQIRSAQIYGLEQREILIEGIKTRGLKQLQLTGLADSWLRESREKISQIIQDFVSWSPVERLLIHLLPPEIAKTGAHLEVPIALACLALCHSEALSEVQLHFLKSHIFVGALSLDGTLVATPVSEMVEAACPEAIGPRKVKSIGELWEMILDPALEHTLHMPTTKEPRALGLTTAPNVEGRYWERLLLLGASLSQVPVLFLGPPGVGKSHLARWGAGTKAPSRSSRDLEEIQQIWSLAGMKSPAANPLVTPQPRSHLSEFTGTASSGSSRPGYFSLSHRGTLLVDEFTELSKDCREILRFILDEKKFMKFSKAGNVVWPADFWFLTTSNPCPCGYSIGEDFSKCRCTENARFSYRNRFSGPIWDRLGLKLFLDKKDPATKIAATLRELLDAPPPVIHRALTEWRPAYEKKIPEFRGRLRDSLGFLHTSPRNHELKARVWSALACIDPSRNDEEWLALLGIHQSTEDAWRG